MGAATLASAAPRVPSGLIESADTSSRIVALTFDDGPSVYTPQVLVVLRRFHVPATFFIVGYEVPIFPQYLRDEVKAGEQIGNHTYSHLDLQRLSTPEVVAQIARNQQIIRKTAGVVPSWFRPPYMDVDGRIIGTASSLGLRTVTWNVDPSDWAIPPVSQIVAGVVGNVEPGSIVIMHDGGGDRSHTVAALPTIIRLLKRKGYRFATLDQLFGLARLPPCVPNAPRIYSRDGISAHPRDPVYRAWADLLCRLINLGPATSPERRLKHGMLAQDFRTTAHRIQVTAGAHPHVKVILEWSWAAHVFSKHHIKPKYGHPITQSWFRLYFRGHNRGPALTKAHWQHGKLIQHFSRGWAIQSSDRVVWQSHIPSSGHPHH